MRADQALERLGGLASSQDLFRLTSRASVRAAVTRGDVVREAPGRYVLPGVDAAMRAAHGLSGVLMEDSAAQYHGWELKHRPVTPCVGVPRNRNVGLDRRSGLRIRYVDLPVDDVSGFSTAGPPGGMMPARYRASCVRVAECADGRAANPFESVLRAIALDVPGLDVEPQVWVAPVGRPDLGDVRLKVVAEADSFEFHGRRQALKHDCERYNAFVVAGWLVVRFAWEHVMFEPEYVRGVLHDLTGPPPRRALPPSRDRWTA